MSSTQQDPQVQMQRRDAPQQGYGKWIVAGVVLVLVLIFVFSNTAKWEFNFLFLGPYELPGWLMLIISLVIGFLVGLLTSALLRRRRRRELKRKAREY